MIEHTGLSVVLEIEVQVPDRRHFRLALRVAVIDAFVHRRVRFDPTHCAEGHLHHLARLHVEGAAVEGWCHARLVDSDTRSVRLLKDVLGGEKGEWNSRLKSEMLSTRLSTSVTLLSDSCRRCIAVADDLLITI